MGAVRASVVVSCAAVMAALVFACTEFGETPVGVEAGAPDLDASDVADSPPDASPPVSPPVDSGSCSTDLQSDPGNCGACGVMCNSKHCTAGRCDPVVFVTSKKSNGILGGIAGADARCVVAASTAKLRAPIQFRAWVGTIASGPMDRGLKLGPRPVWRADGKTMIAASGEAFAMGTLAAAIQQDENGKDGDQSVWTGATAMGQPIPMTCTNWSATTGTGAVGDSHATTAAWADASGTKNCAEMHPIYCVENTEP